MTPRHLHRCCFQLDRLRRHGSGREQAAEHCLRRVRAGVLGAAQASVPGRADPQGDRGVQQAVLRLVVQPLRAGEGEVPGDGRQVCTEGLPKPNWPLDAHGHSAREPAIECHSFPGLRSPFGGFLGSMTLDLNQSHNRRPDPVPFLSGLTRRRP